VSLGERRLDGDDAQLLASGACFGDGARHDRDAVSRCTSLVSKEIHGAKPAALHAVSMMRRIPAPRVSATID
jgi:hypothetical protein